jgi:hypothetical protein
VNGALRLAHVLLRYDKPKCRPSETLLTEAALKSYLPDNANKLMQLHGFIIIGCLYLTIWSRKMEVRGSCARDEQMLLFVIYTHCYNVGVDFYT